MAEHLELIRQQAFSLRQSGERRWRITALPLALTRVSRNQAHVQQPLLDEFAAEQIVSPPQKAFAATIA